MRIRNILFPVACLSMFCCNSTKQHMAIITDLNRVILSWDLPADQSDTDRLVWFTRIYRNGSVISEVNNDLNNYTDSLAATVMTGAILYQVSAVNYSFKESELSSGVSVLADVK